MKPKTAHTEQLAIMEAYGNAEKVPVSPSRWIWSTVGTPEIWRYSDVTRVKRERSGLALAAQYVDTFELSVVACCIMAAGPPSDDTASARHATAITGAALFAKDFHWEGFWLSCCFKLVCFW
eukprot:1184291-Prorocentrum_minimum.AAC.5